MSPRTKEQVEEMRQKSMEQILAAALELFAKKGFDSTSISQIAKLAGVSKGLIYNYFESKDALLGHIIETAMVIGDELMDGLLDEDGDPIQQLKQLVDRVFDMVAENPVYWKLLTGLSFKEDIMTKFGDTMSKHMEKGMVEMVRLLNQIGVPNAEMEALYMGATLDGILLHFIFMGDQYPLEQVKEIFKHKIEQLANIK